MIGRAFRSRVPTVLLALAPLVFMPAGLEAQAEGPREDAALAGVPTTLEEAVEATLRWDPQIERARQTVAQREGELRQARGLFDPVFLTDFAFDFTERELLSRRITGEIQRRVQLEFAADALDLAGAGIIDRLPTLGSLLLDECEPWQTIFIVELSDGTDITLCMFDNQLAGILKNDLFRLGGLDPAQADLLRRFGLDDLPLLLILQELDDLGILLDQTQEQILRAFADILRVLARQLRLGADALRLQRSRLGDLPTDEQLYTLDLDLTYQHRFLNGLSVSQSLALGGTEDHFAGKPLHPRFGDSLIPNAFNVAVGVGLDIPLGKGRGEVAAAAPIRAAEARLLAARELLAHTASQRVLGTVLAYWNLASARETLALLEESAATQARLVEATDALIEGDELVATERFRAGARYAEARRLVAQARQSLVEARMGLVAAIGMPPTPLEEAPLAVDELGAPVDARDPADTWIAAARANRHDLRAAAAAREAAETLARAARADLRRQVDLSLQASYGGFHESFDDRLYDLGGYWEAATGRIAGPSYSAVLRFSFPFGNRAARGRLIQAEASATRNEITETDLLRRIRLAIIESHGSLAEASARSENLRRSLSELQSTLDASLERFRVGDLSLIDTLTTEQQLTDTRLALVDNLRRLAVLEARLRFESGQLLAPGESPDLVDAALITAAPSD